MGHSVTSLDPWDGLLIEPGTLNAYAYVLNDPLSTVDVLGYWPDWNAIGGWISDHKGAIVGAAVGIAVGACIAATGGICGAVGVGIAGAASGGGLAGLGASIGIGAVSGAAGGAASYAVTGDGDGQYSWSGFGSATAGGAVGGAVGGGLGYGVTAGLRSAASRIAAAHTRNTISSARNSSRGWSARPNTAGRSTGGGVPLVRRRECTLDSRASTKLAIRTTSSVVAFCTRIHRG